MAFFCCCCIFSPLCFSLCLLFNEWKRKMNMNGKSWLGDSMRQKQIKPVLFKLSNGKHVVQWLPQNLRALEQENRVCGTFPCLIFIAEVLWTSTVNIMQSEFKQKSDISSGSTDKSDWRSVCSVLVIPWSCFPFLSILRWH